MSHNPPTAPDDDFDLLALSIAVFGTAASYFRWSLALGVVSAGLGLAGSLLSEGTPSTVQLAVGLGAAVALVGSFLLFSSYQSKYRLALEIRRNAMIKIGLGIAIPNFQRTSLLDRAGGRTRSTYLNELPEAQRYYAITAPPGPARILEMLQESVFFTYHLYRTFSKFLFGVILVLILMAVIGAWVVMLESPEMHLRIQATRFAIAFIPAVISLGLAGQAFALRTAANGIERIDSGLEALRPAPNDVEVLRLFGEYQCLLELGLVIPRPLYRYCRDNLNRLWTERMGQVRWSSASAVGLPAAGSGFQ